MEEEETEKDPAAQSNRENVEVKAKPTTEQHREGRRQRVFLANTRRSSPSPCVEQG